ncbi:hypothetical protein [Bifidobacterium callimiconis]|uniref:Uncharacterized protein n=1 Tax=Bifidobacterium callimiconis TaxID=2306973 RepID=A0A430FEU3_9BIFI|nr:hypothetical protein [Bifidobacterium callimiconis]RSX51262.1 hypothetical protein D2E23_1107 [Bifidobacterium callimiconis]
MRPEHNRNLALVTLIAVCGVPLAQQTSGWQAVIILMAMTVAAFQSDRHH